MSQELAEQVSTMDSFLSKELDLINEIVCGKIEIPVLISNNEWDKNKKEFSQWQIFKDIFILKY